MIDLTGLETRPAQTWGALRLVPLVRRAPIEDLRLHAKVYGDELSVVTLPDRSLYTAYVPHAFVASWTADGTPAAAYGTQLGQPLRHVPIRIRRRMARRADKHRLRFLPLHLAIEGFLALHFGGPETAWDEWSRQALAHGLSPRIEEAYSGAEVRGLEDALKVFEIHPGQCGLLLYAGDTLATAFVVPHPEDYRALHPTLVRDMYGDLIHEYALYYPARDFTAELDADAIGSLADLREAAARVEREWAEFHDSVMAAGPLGAPDRVTPPPRSASPRPSWGCGSRGPGSGTCCGRTSWTATARRSVTAAGVLVEAAQHRRQHEREHPDVRDEHEHAAVDGARPQQREQRHGRGEHDRAHLQRRRPAVPAHPHPRGHADGHVERHRQIPQLGLLGVREAEAGGGAEHADEEHPGEHRDDHFDVVEGEPAPVAAGTGGGGGRRHVPTVAAGVRRGQGRRPDMSGNLGSRSAGPTVEPWTDDGSSWWRTRRPSCSTSPA